MEWTKEYLDSKLLDLKDELSKLAELNKGKPLTISKYEWVKMRFRQILEAHGLGDLGMAFEMKDNSIIIKPLTFKDAIVLDKIIN